MFPHDRIIKAALLSALTSVAAQITPSNVDPGRQSLQEAKRAQAIHQQKTETDSKIQTERKARHSRDQLARITFTLESVILHGVQVKQEVVWQRLNQLTQPYVGRTASLADMQDVADKLEQLYRDSGYLLAQVFIPPQHLNKEGARVTLQVIEGKINDVHVKGGTAFTDDAIELFADRVEGKHPLVVKDLEEFILLSNDIPGANVRTVLTASQNVQGAADVQAVVEQKRTAGYLGMNNYAGDYTGPIQTQAGLTVYSMFGPDELSLNAAWVLPQSARLRYVGGAYHRLVGQNGDSIRFSANHSKSKPGGPLASLALQGAGLYGDAAYRHVFKRSKQENITGTIGGYFRDSENRSTSANATFYEDRVRAAYAEIDWSFSDFARGFNDFNFKATQAFRMANASRKGDPFLSRANAGGDFFKVNAEMSRSQPIADAFTAFVAFNAQYAFQALLSSEQFGYGGSAFGTGYDSSEITGDRGFAFRLEARHDYIPGWPGLQWLQSYGFWDIGKIFNISNENQAGTQSAASAGFGARFQAESQISGTFEYAMPLTREIASTENTKGRLFFNLISRV